MWTVFAVVMLFGFVVFRGAPYVPSHARFARKALSELYPLSKDDVLVDLGSGDGIILRIAAKSAKRVVGYELNPALVLISRLLARGDKKIETKLADIWLTDMPDDTTIVYAFAVSRDVGKLRKKLQKFTDDHARPLWLITYGAGLDGIEPEKRLQAHNLYCFTPKKG